MTVPTVRLPWIVARFGVSLDGQIVDAPAGSPWESGTDMLAFMSMYAGRRGAIVVGAGRVSTNDPGLVLTPTSDPRFAGLAQPQRVVADSVGRISVHASVLSGEPRTLIATTERAPDAWVRALRVAGGEVQVYPMDRRGHLDLRAFLCDLRARGFEIALFDGGSRMLGSLFELQLVDRVQALVSPTVVGGRPPVRVSADGVRRFVEAPRLADVSVVRMNPHMLVEGTPLWSGGVDSSVVPWHKLS